MSKPDLQIRKQQEQWLQHCLQDNKNSQFGKHYNFAAIRNIQDYQQQVPLHHYHDLKPWIDRLVQGEQSVLFDSRVIAFERTSGSTHASKMIPYSEKSLLDFQKVILPWLKNISEHYKLNNGFVYWALSPATRTQEFTDSGVAIGLSDELYLGENISAFFTLQSAVPEWVGTIENVKKWQFYTLYWLISRKELSLISVWSPTFFIVLLEAISDHYACLKSLFLKGGTYHDKVLPSDNDAYQRLEKYRVNKDTKILWPHLKLVSCWADSSSASYCTQLKKMLNHAKFQAKGLLLTEGVISIPDKNGQAVLASQSGFFEFNKDGKLLLADELAPGVRYEVVITTSGGLYRYYTRDIVLFEGYNKDGLPILRFSGRCGIQSDLVGEKLTEEFVSRCLSFISGFSILLPCREKKPYYQLLLDEVSDTEYSEIEQKIDQKLSQNPHYAYARKMTQLGKIKVHTIKQPLEKYQKLMINNGMRMGDIKIPALSADPELLSSLSSIKIGAVQT